MQRGVKSQRRMVAHAGDIRRFVVGFAADSAAVGDSL